MATFDEIQVTTLLALTHPNSPYFLKAMSELRTLDMQKEYDSKIIDRAVLAILNDKSLEKDLLVHEQLERARETHAKYLDDYAAYQQAVYKQAQDDLNLSPNQLNEYLSTQNSKLDQELEAWDVKLKNLPKDQAEITKQWSDMQEKSGAEFAKKLEGLSITSADGKASELTSGQIEQLKDKIFNASNDPNKLIQYIPSLVDPNPATVQETAAKMERTRMVNMDLNALVELKSLSGSRASDNANLKPSELIKLMQRNREILDITTAATKEQSSVARGLQAKALTTNEVYINKQKELIVNQKETNSKQMEKNVDLKKTPFSLPTPKPSGGVK